MNDPYLCQSPKTVGTGGGKIQSVYLYYWKNGGPPFWLGMGLVSEATGKIARDTEQKLFVEKQTVSSYLSITGVNNINIFPHLKSHSCFSDSHAPFCLLFPKEK